MSDQVIETLIGLGIIAFVAVGIIVYILIRHNANRYESLSKGYEKLNEEQRVDARQREDRLQGTLDKTVDSMAGITDSLQKVNESVSRQSHETNTAINAINQTTTQLGNTVTTLTTTVDGLSKTMSHVVKKINDEEIRRVQSANEIKQDKES